MLGCECQRDRLSSDSVPDDARCREQRIASCRAARKGGHHMRSSQVSALRASLASLAVLAVASLARAELVSMDSEYGPGTITHDTETGIDWLDLTLTTNRS